MTTHVLNITIKFQCVYCDEIFEVNLSSNEFKNDLLYIDNYYEISFAEKCPNCHRYFEISI